MATESFWPPNKMTKSNHLFYRSLCLLAILACGLVPFIAAADATKAPTDVKPGSITYEDVPYPYPVSYLPLTLYGQDVRMAYMDIRPPASQTAALSFCSTE